MQFAFALPDKKNTKKLLLYCYLFDFIVRIAFAFPLADEKKRDSTLVLPVPTVLSPLLPILSLFLFPPPRSSTFSRSVLKTLSFTFSFRP